MTRTTLKALLALSDHIHIQHICLPAWQGKTDQHFYRYYKALKNKIAMHNGTIMMIKKPMNYGSFSINVSKQKRLYNTIEFYELLLDIKTI